MNDNLKVKVEITDYIKDENYPNNKLTIRSAFCDDDMVVLEGRGVTFKVAASEIIKAAQLCSHNRW